jgi:hypothetical protein
LKPVGRLIDRFFNLLIFTKASFHKEWKRKSEIIVNACFDEDFQLLMDSFRTKEAYIKRNSAHFDWILRYPWIQQGKPDKESLRYFFSSKSQHFEYCSLKVYQDKKLTGYALLKIRDKALTVSYLYTSYEGIRDITSYIMEKTEKEGIKMITAFEERLADEIKKQYRNLYLFSKKIKRPYIITKKKNISSFSFQEGDGDSVFT